jgi:transcriptional regulator with XRE-family HTH domain
MTTTEQGDAVAGGLGAPSLVVWRNHRAYSQADLGKRAKVSASTINRIEQGYPARPSTLRKLARALRCQPADLMAEPEADNA